ncbi:hypothetical protein ACFPT7_14740 [Acidicapsa dinghuensis]|uniref:Uncharacterized protein n=1 Tax=Acidicapsa dinghuensis TaxID=2218256 RepID=A0ABW1EH04_9BACT|nr:hypothetical protein [Acidicapsa dinghuensis]
MNQHKQPDTQLDPLDQVLLNEDTLLPTSGFAASVMDQIEAEAAAPAPIPFPWKHALPGLAALLIGLYCLYRLASTTFTATSQSSLTTDWLHWLRSTATPAVILRTQAAPALFALVGAWLCVFLCSKLAGGWSTR